MDNIELVKNSDMDADSERSEKCLLFNQLIQAEYGDYSLPASKGYWCSSESKLLLSRYFGVSDSLWANLQAHYNLECAKDTLEEKLSAILCNFIQ